MTSCKALIILTVIFDIILCCIGALKAEDMIKCENILTQIGFKSKTGFYNLMFIWQFDTYDKFKKQVEDMMGKNVANNFDYFNELYVEMKKEEIKSDIVYTPEEYCTNSLDKLITESNHMMKQLVPALNPNYGKLNQLREELQIKKLTFSWNDMRTHWNDMRTHLKDHVTNINQLMNKLMTEVQTEIPIMNYELDMFVTNMNQSKYEDMNQSKDNDLDMFVTNMNKLKYEDMNDEQRKFRMLVNKLSREFYTNMNNMMQTQLKTQFPTWKVKTQSPISEEVFVMKDEYEKLQTQLQTRFPTWKDGKLNKLMTEVQTQLQTQLPTSIAGELKKLKGFVMKDEYGELKYDILALLSEMIEMNAVLCRKKTEVNDEIIDTIIKQLKKINEKNKKCTDEIITFKYDETGIKDTVLRYEKDNPFKNHITSYIINSLEKNPFKQIPAYNKGNSILEVMKNKKFTLQYFNYHKDIFKKHSKHYTKFLPSNICKNKQMPQMPKALLDSVNITKKEK